MLWTFSFNYLILPIRKTSHPMHGTLTRCIIFSVFTSRGRNFTSRCCLSLWDMRKNSPDPLSTVKNTAKRTWDIQILYLNYGDKIPIFSFWYLRIYFHPVILEAHTVKYLSRNLFHFMVKQDELTITKIIFSRKKPVKQGENSRFIHLPSTL